jgi:hypothetical protein
VLCLEGSWCDTLDDRQTLEMLRYLNRTGSMFSRVVCRVYRLMGAAMLLGGVVLIRS